MDEQITKLRDTYEGFVTHTVRFERVTKDTTENLLAFLMLPLLSWMEMKLSLNT